MSLPKTYRAAVIEKPKTPFKIVEKEMPTPGPTQVLLKVSASAICHSDHYTVDGLHPKLKEYPTVPGHEFVGEVVDAGTQKKYKIGTMLGGRWQGSHCYECQSCLKGDFITCRNPGFNGITSDGGYAEYALLDISDAVVIPDGMDPVEAAPLLCGGLTAFNSLRNMGLKPQDTVAVQGVGGIGHLAVSFAAKMGFNVIVISSGSDKKQFALELGASEYIDQKKEDPVKALQAHGGAQLILTTAPKGEVIAPLVLGLAPRGTLLLIALVPEIKFQTMPMIANALTIRGWPSGSSIDAEDTLRFAQRTGVKTLIETCSLDEVQSAYEAMMNNEVRFKKVIVMNN